MKKIELRLNGKPAVIGGPGPQAAKVLAFIKSIPEGEYFTADGIRERLRMASREAVSELLRKHPEEVSGYMVLVAGLDGNSKQSVFGSKKAISKLKAQLEIE